MKSVTRQLERGQSVGMHWAARFLLGLLLITVGNPAIGLGQPYPSEDDLIEVMFEPDSRVRLRGGVPVDLEAKRGLTGVSQVLQGLAWSEWQPISDVPEARLDEIQAQGQANTGQPVYNLNSIFRLRIPKGLDVWAVSKELEALPGVMLARPVPKPTPPPYPPPNYMPNQGYLRAASIVPSGIGADFIWTQSGGIGTGVTVCDLEYSWNYTHGDISKALGSQINTNVADPFANTNHGTAVIGELVSDLNGWGTTGVCYGAGLKTCGTYYGLPAPSWNVPGAIAVAIANLSPGDVILLEQQWEYTSGSGNYIPIEWWLNYSPSAQTFNGVYAAITNAVALGIHVVEAGGNGGVNTDALAWFGNSGAIIVGAGGVNPGGTYPEGDRQRISFSSYGLRFDLQGWGEDVVTTGYGTLYNADGVNYYYTSSFSGTSSASPIVAGAVTCIMGYWKANFTGPLATPALLRTALITTGTPQIMPPAGHIGPRPDLQSAIANLCSCPCHGDPQCDGVQCTLQDVVQTVNVAFRGGAPVFDPQCPHENTDVNCDNATSVQDVVKVVNVAFRGGNLATEFCNPCP
jgi:serine protease